MSLRPSISRAYALAVYGESNRVLLKKEDREALDLVFVVTDGSNGLNAVGEAIDNLTKQLVAKLTGNQVMAMVTIFILMYFSTSTARDFYAANLELKADTLASEERIALSEQETERMKLITQAMDRFGVNPGLKDEAEEGLRALTKPATQEDHSRVRGVDLTKRQAQVVLSGEEKEREGHRLNGDYRIIDINMETETGFIVRLQDIETGQEVKAEANYAELSKEDIHTIFEVAEAKTVLHAVVNAFFVGNKISRAYIVKAYINGS